MLDDFPLLRLSEFGVPSPEELAFIDRHAGPPKRHARQAVLRNQGEVPDCVYFLLEGWVASAVAMRTGERQIVKIHLPGDMLGCASLCLTESADTLYALSPVAARKLPAAAFGSLFAEFPDFAARCFLTAQRERVAMMDRLAAVGAKPATGRLAALLLDLYERLSRMGHVRDYEFMLRLTQDEIGDYLGLTSVHVNRTFRHLEESGMIARRLQRVRLVDMESLADISGYIKRELDAGCTEIFRDRSQRA